MVLHGLAGLVMGIKMRPLVPDLSSGQTWPENPAPLFTPFDGRYHDDDYHDSDDTEMLKLFLSTSLT